MVSKNIDFLPKFVRTLVEVLVIDSKIENDAEFERGRGAATGRRSPIGRFSLLVGQVVAKSLGRNDSALLFASSQTCTKERIALFCRHPLISWKRICLIGVEIPALRNKPRQD